MKRLFLVVSASVLLFSTAPTASAGNWDFGVNAGLAVPLGNLEETIQSAFAWSLYLEYDFTPNVALQGRFGRHVHELSSDFKQFGGATAPPELDLSGDFDINELVLDLKISIPVAKKTSIYLLAGGGAYIWNLDFGPLRTTEGFTPRGADGTDPGLMGGLGLEHTINTEVGFTAEVDYTYIFGNFEEGYITYLAGLVFHF